MSRPFKPANVPSLMPYLVVRDPAAAMDFYENTFGFKRDGEPMVEDGQIIHCEMVFGDARIMIGLEGCWGCEARSPTTSGIDQGIGLYLYCEDVDNHFQRTEAAQGQITQPLDNMFWGDRMYSVKDQDGYRWSFATNVGDCVLPGSENE